MSPPKDWTHNWHLGVFWHIHWTVCGGGGVLHPMGQRRAEHQERCWSLIFHRRILWFSWYLLLKNFRELFICRIVPYFESHVATYPDNQPDAFDTGIFLVRHCRQLDDIAKNIGVKPLSDFGFKDDQDAQKLIWHESSEGIRTVEVLVAKMSDGTTPSDLMTDLVRLRDYLRKAQAKGIRFCLIIRAGLDKFISPVEMDNRKGRFW